jgi:hypothetical protein
MSSIETASILKLPLTFVRSAKEIVIQKGYTAYDKEAYSFL